METECAKSLGQEQASCVGVRAQLAVLSATGTYFYDDVMHRPGMLIFTQRLFWGSCHFDVKLPLIRYEENIEF